MLTFQSLNTCGGSNVVVTSYLAMAFVLITFYSKSQLPRFVLYGQWLCRNHNILIGRKDSWVMSNNLSYLWKLVVTEILARHWKEACSKYKNIKTVYLQNIYLFIVHEQRSLVSKKLEILEQSIEQKLLKVSEKVMAHYTSTLISLFQARGYCFSQLVK